MTRTATIEPSRSRNLCSSFALLGLTILACLLAAVLAPLASAHSLKELEDQLLDREKYFQPVDIAAPEFTLVDAGGRTVSFADFRGKVVVLNFIYTNCPDVCPLHAEKIAGIQSLINHTPMRDLVAFVTITTDPKRDHGPVLNDYGKAHGLDPANWVSLTAGPDQSEDTTRKLAKAYGLEFTPGGDGVMVHGVVTHVIDQHGRMLARFHRLDFDPTNFILFVNALTNHLQDHRH
jgi:protein SCO1/2